jgi:K+ transporter
VLTLENSSAQRNDQDPAPPCARDGARGRRLAGLTVAAIDVPVRYGFTETPDVPAALLPCQLGPPEPSIMDTSFFLSRETYIPSGRPDLPPWREQLFIHLANSALDATRFFKLPPDRMVEVGSQVDI